MSRAASHSAPRICLWHQSQPGGVGALTGDCAHMRRTDRSGEGVWREVVCGTADHARGSAWRLRSEMARGRVEVCADRMHKRMRKPASAPALAPSASPINSYLTCIKPGAVSHPLSRPVSTKCRDSSHDMTWRLSCGALRSCCMAQCMPTPYRTTPAGTCTRGK